MKDKIEIILLEILRVSLISIRNISNCYPLPKCNKQLVNWAELGHVIPSIIIGGCHADSIRYFIDVNCDFFLKNYPNKDVNDFVQIKKLISELSDELPIGEDRDTHK